MPKHDNSIPETRGSQENLDCKEKDPDYCPSPPMVRPPHKYSLNTAKLIVADIDRGLREKAIQSRYPWYKRQMLPKMRKLVQQIDNQELAQWDSSK